MQPVGGIPLRKRSPGPSPMEQGVQLLRSVAGHDGQAPGRRPTRRQCHLSKSAQAISRFYRKMDECKQDASPQDTSFAAQLEELRKVFLARPDCPRFSTRATSTSKCHYDAAVTTKLSEELCGALDSWKGTQDPFSRQQASSQQVDGHLLPFSKSACEFNHLWRKSEPGTPSPVPSSPVLAQSQLRKRVPWYISVIHEKDDCLLTLGEEVQRLSQLEVLLRKKDEELLALQEEREALKKQLKFLLHSKSQDILEKFSAIGRGKDLEVVGGEEEAEEAKGRVGRGEAAPKAWGEEAEEQLEEEVVELEEEEEVQQDEAERKTSSRSLEDAFEQELIAQLEEYEQMIQEVQEELEVTRTRYSVATGAIISLQRQVDFQEAQLQRMRTENETLQKELRERKDQLHAMSNKFSNLRENKKHEEMMGFIEKDNLLLRQEVAELQSRLAKQEHTILEFNAKVSQLQDQVSQKENHLQRWKWLQEEMASKNELIHQAELQARVALESTQSRLERLRNKIIQATFSTPGSKSLATEISDNDILESLQKIISERADYYSQLKQRGVRMPPLHPSESSSSSSPGKSKKTASK